LRDIRSGAPNADPQDIVEGRNALFPDNQYPGGWLDNNDEDNYNSRDR
jgi:hypothetical protein